MKARYQRELEFRHALAKLYPHMPAADALAAAQRMQRPGLKLDAHILYCAAAAAARHGHTEYDRLCPPDADNLTKQTARETVRPAERAKLIEWGGPDRDPG